VSSTPLGPGAEFDVIRSVLRDATAPGAMVALGAGDDCALLRSGDAYLAVTVDLFVEGVHFMSSWGCAEEIGGRAARAAISDLAAMAAEPAAILVSLSAPAGEGPELAERIGAGCRDAAEALDASLIGGDLSRGGPGLALDVAAVGYVEEPLLRSGARPGDEIWVTGRLGAAAAAVGAWKAGLSVADEWRERFWNPTPRVREARWLAERGASAAIDLSDGLLADAGHIAAASGVGLEIDYEAVPAASGVHAEAALGGGEDYELLVAVPDGILSAEATTEFERAFAIPLTRVGRAVSGTGVRVFRDGVEVQVASRGFDHFMGIDRE
jgi:thiamine-monophosphate kinase